MHHQSSPSTKEIEVKFTVTVTGATGTPQEVRDSLEEYAQGLLDTHDAAQVTVEGPE
jgi:hypothetical protein